MLIINFKNYPQAIGPKALELTQKLLEVAKEYPKVQVGFAPPLLELAEVAKHTKAPIWAQHIDPAPAGQYTGYLAPADAKSTGAVGVFLNHSEHPIDVSEAIKKTMKLVHQEDLKVLIFARNPEDVKRFSWLTPEFIAYEPPELIGGKISVSTAKPEVISEAVKASGQVPLLVGAGIHNKTDISAALDLGAVGAVVSSAVVTASNPKAVLANLLAGFKV